VLTAPRPASPNRRKTSSVRAAATARVGLRNSIAPTPLSPVIRVAGTTGNSSSVRFTGATERPVEESFTSTSSPSGLTAIPRGSVSCTPAVIGGRFVP